MSLDTKVTKINSIIQEQAKVVFSGSAPDVTVLEKEIVDFIADIKKLPAADAKQYLDIVAIWAGEVRKLSDKLSETKNSLEGEITKAGAQGKGVTAYTKASKFNDNNNE